MGEEVKQGKFGLMAGDWKAETRLTIGHFTPIFLKKHQPGQCKYYVY